MLLRLLRTHLAPYRTWLTIIVALQFTATAAMLYLPSLNADIIDKGIAEGDTGVIVRIGALMLGVTLVQAVCSMSSAWFGGRTAMAFGRDLRTAIFKSPVEGPVPLRSEGLDGDGQADQARLGRSGEARAYATASGKAMLAHRPDLGGHEGQEVAWRPVQAHPGALDLRAGESRHGDPGHG